MPFVNRLKVETRLVAVVLATTLVFIVGCGPATSSLGSVVPPGIDLTGIWVLDAERSNPPPDPADARERLKAIEIEGKKTAPLGSILYATQDFPVIAAERLAIEQDASSIGISYGDGQHRDLVWGLQTRSEWKIDAGWHQSKLFVKSAVSHTSGSERYELDAAGETLFVTVEIRAGPDRSSFRRTFTKAQ